MDQSYKKLLIPIFEKKLCDNCIYKIMSKACPFSRERLKDKSKICSNTENPGCYDRFIQWEWEKEHTIKGQQL